MKHARHVGEAREHLTKLIVDEYQGGASIRQIGLGYGLSYGKVHRVLSDAGVTLRGRGGSVKKPRTAPPKPEVSVGAYLHQLHEKY